MQRDFSAILSSRTQSSGRLPAHRRQVCMLWTHPNRLSRSAELVGPHVTFVLLQESPEGLRHLVPTPASGTRPFPATATTAAALTRSTGPARQESRFLREPGHFRGAQRDMTGIPWRTGQGWRRQTYREPTESLLWEGAAPRRLPNRTSRPARTGWRPAPPERRWRLNSAHV